MKPQVAPERTRRTDTDFRLAIATLEKKVLAGEDGEKTRRVLANPRIYSALPDNQRLRWAGLAQMCGEVEAALAILDTINRSSPQNHQAWRDHIALLRILDRQNDAARVLALARRQLGDTTLADLLPPVAAVPSDSVPSNTRPGAFDRLRRRERQIQRYMSLFGGREDAFARQWADRAKSSQGYVPVRRPMSATDIADHLKSRFTYGVYLLRADSTTRLGVIDADLIPAFRKGRQDSDTRRRIYREKTFMMSRIKELSAGYRLTPLVEFSGGKGFHFWYCFQEPIPAARVRDLLNTIARQVSSDLSAFTLEIFPKQDRLGGKGFGNLVKLPLGIHRGSGKPSVFVDCADRGIDAQLDFLANVVPADPKALGNAEKIEPKASVVAHPRWQQWTDDFPELARLCECCAPLGQIICLCREGRTPSQREERILFQTVGMLGRAKTLMHHLYSFTPDYNPHWVDFRLSRLRGTPLGCRRIHSLMNHAADLCVFPHADGYAHPLRHLDKDAMGEIAPRSEKTENLNDALEHLQSAMDRVRHFINPD